MGDALSHLFHVRLDWVDVGLWAECSGLEVEYEMEEYVEGGQNLFVHKLPGRMTFKPIVLTRPIDKDSAKLRKYMASVIIGSAARSTASITVYDADLEAVMNWSFIDVVPKSWKGPTFNAGEEKVAIEEFAFEHHGFDLMTGSL
ncbi:phage tail protein [Nitriliruptor alkaliphilus]|uniref:phage tail protein n=1 Tax=Nitriliruptor alkaliphilus TaxID=427918 RepID=UPI000698C937|nr:phage tail protein [Nitriliruptor alkaliphilus]